MKRLLIVPLLLASLLLAGCGKKIEIANVPAGVSEAEVRAWYEATGILAVVSRTTKDATRTVIDLHGQGLFASGDSYQATLTALGKVAQTEILAAQYLDSWQEQFGAAQAEKFRDYLDRIANALTEATGSGLLGIKSEETRAAFLVALSLIRSAVRQGLDLAALFQVSSRGLVPGHPFTLEVRYA